MDVDEVAMLIRAVLASKKGPTSIKELSSEYYDCNGTHIPYKHLGFDSLITFLECHRDKFELYRDHNTGEFQIKVVVDENILGLRKLVTGQKGSTKKKKTAPKRHPFAPAPKNKNFFRPAQNVKAKPFFRNDHYDGPINKPQHQHVKTTKKIDPKPMIHIKSNNPVKKMEVKHVPSEPVPFKQTDKKGPLVDELDKENLFITNASYFLKEHEVIVTCVEDCHKFYIRLIGPDFSGEYAALREKMNSFYEEKVNRCPIVNPRANDYCVVNDKYRFYRAQIRRLISEAGSSIECFLLDEGRTNTYDRKDLFKLDEKFSNLKFQAILVQIEYFEYFHKNDFIREQIETKFVKHQYIARRTQTNPLTVALYLKTGQGECASQMFIDQHKFFCAYKPIQDCRFTTFITYICDETSLVHLRSPHLNLEFDECALKINKYLTELPDQVFKTLNETTRNKLTNDAFVKSNLLCAKYYIDSRWYRVKFIKLAMDKETKEQMALVMYVDFGNKELVSLQDLLIFPDDFVLFKNMPPQSFSVTLMNDSIDMSILKELWYENKPLDFTVMRFNSAGIPTVKMDDQLLKQFKSNMENELAQSMKNLTLEEVEENNLDEVRNVVFKDLAVVDFPITAPVYIRYVNNPSDFVINLECYHKEYQAMLRDMKVFYEKRSREYTVKKVNKDYIYVCRLDNSDYIRVKYVENVIGDHIKIYNIDAGNFDAVKMTSLFHITARFLKIKPQAIKAELANVTFDLKDKWSEAARSHFEKLIDKRKTYKAKMVKFSAETDYFRIELTDSLGRTLSAQMIQSGYSK